MKEIFDRKSVRKFSPEPVPREDIIKMVNSAKQAPSGRNSQNWHFIAITNKEILEKARKLILDKNNEICARMTDSILAEKFSKYSRFHAFFADAPLSIFVYYSDYSSTGVKEMEAAGYSESEINYFLEADPKIQNIGAAIQNLLLSATELGYGTCWMTGPLYASAELMNLIKPKKEGLKLAAIIPVGRPLNPSDNKVPRKDISEILEIRE